jgi:hypothetical protein
MPTPDTARITPVVAAHVLYVYDEFGGYAPGAFINELIKLIGRADPVNRRLLALGFPEYVAACEEIETPGGGVEALQALAKQLQHPDTSQETLHG